MMFVFGLFTSLVLFAIFGETTFANSCKQLQNDAAECWNDNKGLPDCIESYPLVQCAEDALNAALRCNVNIVDDIKVKEDMYQGLHMVICNHPELHKEFAKDQSCWILARSCAYDSLRSKYDKEELTEEKCSEINNRFDACKGPLPDSSCPKLQDILIRYIRSNHPCSKLITWNGTVNCNTYNISLLLCSLIILLKLIM